MKLTNSSNVSISLAVWLAHDTYDQTGGRTDIPEGTIISATTLLKPTRQIVLGKRLPPEEQTADVTDFIASRMGHALHDSVENAWKTGYRKALTKLGYPQKVIDAIRINPEVVEPNTIPVYLEQRAFKQHGKYVISGQLDQIIEGSLQDIKSTSTFTYMSGNKDEDYAEQGGIYRWLNPDLVTSDVMRIQHIFTDWQRFRANQDPNYPQHRVQEVTVKLPSLEETEKFIDNKLRDIEHNMDLPEPQIVRCTDKELWRSDTVWKYYKNPATAAEGGRATKNFDTDKAGAYEHLAKMGVGVVKEFPGTVKACAYCPVYDLCSQKDEYIHDRT